MKRLKGGSVSNEQKDWHEYLTSIGHVVLICKGADDAKAQIFQLASTLEKENGRRDLDE
jgi:hypothetical protein